MTSTYSREKTLQERVVQTKNASVQFNDQRPHKQLLQPQESAETSSVQRASEDNQSAGTVQREENNTGLPDQLKSGMENVSGMSLSNVKVHYNSDKPAAVQAHAYAQGTDIHLGPGQEKHLPHELGHVVQQAEGRVKPTTEVAGVPVNDSASLENEATQMGDRALKSSR